MTELILPDLIVQFKANCGVIKHLIIEKGTYEIDSITQIKVSPRVSENLYKLRNGQRIIVTSRSKILLPDEANGVLQVKEGEQPRWIEHNLKRNFIADVTNRGLRVVSREISDSWINQFTFAAEQQLANGQWMEGLRPPQIGGLYAIGAHWSLSNQPATIVMPTGTGKTETMLSALIAHRPGKVLVIVPSKILREQTGNKFLRLGLLRRLGAIPPDIKNPIVGVIDKRPRNVADLDIFDKCNVIVSTMSALGAEDVLDLASEIASKIDTLIVDEAHHVPATSWSDFREHFDRKKTLQFTATPFRRDGKLVDGKVIFSYPLHRAQEDGYFKSISFLPVYEIDDQGGDRAVAELAVEKLRDDIASGLDHLLMARCSSIDRAASIVDIYAEIAPEFNPIVVHSEKSGEIKSSLDRVFSRESRIVVCVNMLGEGFDLPQLKIAALHDTHKSLAIILQFTGRFTRSAAHNIGDATVIANIANQEVSTSLERLYSEDADWNKLLSEFSSEAARSHAELVEFLNSSRRLDVIGENDEIDISNHLLRPKLTTLMYEIDEFNPNRFFEGLPADMLPQSVWHHEESNTIYFVTLTEYRIQWTRSREIKDRQWDLFVLHYNPDQRLLYLSSSNKESNFEQLAWSVGATQIKRGEAVFRALSQINRLVFQNVGVKKHGRRNLSFALYTGADVVTALTIADRAGSEKSNLSGVGWENGEPVTIGCSFKGRVWSKDVVSIPELIQWCDKVGTKVLDDTISTNDIIANVLIPEEVEALPDKFIISIEWPMEILRQAEEKVLLIQGDTRVPIYAFDLQIVETRVAENQIEFKITTAEDQVWAHFILSVGGDRGFHVVQIAGNDVNIKNGRIELPLQEYFSNYPPLIRFVDLSELDGNLLIRPQHPEELHLPEEQFVAWDWTGVDIKKESYWKNGQGRQDSIQWRAVQEYQRENFDVIFDDDSAGEAADLVCLKEQETFIRLTLIHCKFTTSNLPGERVKDVVEVCSQAIRSSKWKWKFKDLCRHLIYREARLRSAKRPTRFIVGNEDDVNRISRAHKFKEVKVEIAIVQPGVSKEAITPDQSIVLASAYTFLQETIEVDIEIICSA